MENETIIERQLAVYLMQSARLRQTLNPGKAAAQAHHAGFQLASKYQDHPLVREYANSPEADHFGVTITLLVPEEAIMAIIEVSRSLGYIADMVIDPTYPLGDGFTAEVLTFGYILADRNDPRFRLLTDAYGLAP